MKKIYSLLFPLCLTILLSIACKPNRTPSKSKAEAYLKEELKVSNSEISSIQLMDSAFFQKAPYLLAKKDQLKTLLSDFNVSFQMIRDSLPSGSFVMDTHLKGLGNSVGGMEQALETFDGVALEDGIGHAYSLAADMAAINASLTNHRYEGDSLFNIHFESSMSLAEEIKSEFTAIESWGTDFFIEDLLYYLKYEEYKRETQVPYWVSYQSPEAAEAILLYDREKGEFIDHAAYSD